MVSLALELITLQGELDFVIDNLHLWMKPVECKVPLVMAPASAEYIYEPLGVCLIIGASNFPILLLLSPLMGAIMAGNCAVIKPSELPVNCERCMMELLPKYIDHACFEVVSGGIDVMTELLSEYELLPLCYLIVWPQSFSLMLCWFKQV